MKFIQFQFMRAWDWIVIIPTIILSTNNLQYRSKNFRLSIHWLGWHLSWLWLEKCDII